MSSRPYILVAEDDRTTQVILSKLLVSEHYEVGLAEDGEQALAMLTERRPDLLITDWMMPHLDGAMLVRQLRASPTTSDLYVIMLTAKADTQDTVEALDAGADDYLAKPFDPGVLLARVRAGLRVAELQAELKRKNAELERTVKELQQALAEVRTLQGLLPMCAWCRKVRTDDEYWETLEQYIRDHTDITFTHGICPECRKRLMKQLLEE